MLQKNLWEVTGWWGSLDRARPIAGLSTLTYGSSLPKPFSSASGWDSLQMDVDFQYDDFSLVSGWECKLREMWQCFKVTQTSAGAQAPHIHSKSNTTQCFKLSRLIFGRLAGGVVGWWGGFRNHSVIEKVKEKYLVWVGYMIPVNKCCPRN